MSVEEARAAIAKGSWSEAYALLTEADALTPLPPEDLDRLAAVAYLLGEDDASMRFRARAHTGFLERGEPIRAAASAFWLGFSILDNPSQRAQATGWLARAQRLVDEAGQPCVERGWLMCATARQRAAAGDLPSTFAAFAEAAEIGARFGDRDLVALARHGQGRALLAMNDTAAGLALLDEVMVAIASGDISPIITGVVYCSVITACNDLFELGRAHEWTAALQTWCESHADVVPFRGYCLIHRSELLQLHGAWADAAAEAERACARFAAGAPRPEAGAAYYQLAELYRVRGEFERADEAYRLASQAGRKPQPGLALLRLSQGQAEAAETAIRLALQERCDRRTRVLLLCAAVEILLARCDVGSARSLADELAALSSQIEVPYLVAVSSHAQGAVALAEGNAIAALDRLRAAFAAWQELDAPYDLARTRTVLGLAYEHLGDGEGARLEFEAAHDIFERLGAAPEAARVASLGQRPAAEAAASPALTGREIEVLRLIATGVTNRTIALKLGISEKTVARHVSNIFTKLDLPSRAAATAYAYEHKLL